METNVSNCNNTRSSIFGCMAKQKLGLTFAQGFFVGLTVMFFIWSGIIQTFFVSKEVFRLNKIYVDGKIYKLCRDN
jgi:hypothetical protein